MSAIDGCSMDPELFELKHILQFRQCGLDSRALGLVEIVLHLRPPRRGLGPCWWALLGLCCMDGAAVLALLGGAQAAAADAEPESEAAEAQPRSARDVLRLLEDPLEPGRPFARNLHGREIALKNRQLMTHRAVAGKQRNAMVNICRGAAARFGP